MTGKPTACILLATIVFATGLAGCASTKKRFEKGVKAEEEGRYEEASEYYIQVLQKEPDWQDARARLQRTGSIVIESRLADADRLVGEGRDVAAADVMRWVRGFHARATAVGAQLDLPDNFADRLDRLEDAAVRMLLRDADEARGAGRWQQALSLYDRALGRGRLDINDQTAVQESKATVFVAWAEQTLKAGYYRAAFDRAQHAIDLVGMEHQLTRRALDVQGQALEAGSMYVAMLPVAAKEGVRRTASTLFMADLNDILVYEYWVAPPPFIVVADPVGVRRELRSVVGRMGRVVSKSEAIAIGRLMDADWVLASELVEFDRSEKKAESRTVRARTRGRSPVDTTYVLEKVDVRYTTRASMRVYEVATGRRLFEGHVDASAHDRFDRGRYAGNPEHLDLSGTEMSYFDREEIRAQEDRLEERLADDLAHKLADTVYSKMVGWIR